MLISVTIRLCWTWGEREGGGGREREGGREMERERGERIRYSYRFVTVWRSVRVEKKPSH